MIRNYLKVALRNIFKHKGYSFINIVGLAIGMACCIMMLLWIQHEYSYDRFNEKVDNLYRVVSEETKGNQTLRSVRLPAPLAPALKSEFPEILDDSLFFLIRGSWAMEINKEKYTGIRIAFVDPSFFKMFSYPLIKGNPDTALSFWKSVVISEDMGKRYFGDEDPMGKLIYFNEGEFKITGVLKNLPDRSHLQFDCVIPFSLWGKLAKQLVSWERFGWGIYVLLQKDADVAQLDQKISGYLAKHIPGSKAKLFLQPLKKIRLHSNFWGDFAVTANIKYVYILYALAFFLLVSACLNFMNLATARSANRSKEIAMRKVVGGNRFDIMRQFFGESLVFACIALIAALILVIIFLPAFNHLSGKQLTLFSLNVFQVLVILIGVTLFTGILSGFYPALFLSSFQPLKIIKGMRGPGSGGSLSRKILVVGQFILSTSLIIAVLVIYKQLDYIKNKDLGFDKENLVVLGAFGDLDQGYEAYKNEMLNQTGIESVTRGIRPVWGEIASTTPDWEGKQPGEDVIMQCYDVSYDYFKTYRMKIKEGRTFSKEFPTDAQNAYVVNETAVKVMGMKSPVGKRFSVEGHDGTIIGVVKDFHHSSLHDKIQPLIFRMGRTSVICVRVKPGTDTMTNTMNFLKSLWEKANTGYPFKEEYLADAIDQFYENEKRLISIFSYFTVLAIFISCLGVFGLVSFMAEHRTKEIGIRKALGASISNIVMLLSREFLLLVILANIIAWPLAYFVLSQWLQDFAYRTDIAWWLFPLAGAAALFVTILTVSFQAIKAAQANPVDSLRYE